SRVTERPPPFSLVYDPPDGIGPAQAAYMLDKKAAPSALVATLLYAAERGAILLDRLDSDGRRTKKWTLAGGLRPEHGLDTQTWDAISALVGSKDSLTISSRSTVAGRKLAETGDNLERAVARWGLDSGNMCLPRLAYAVVTAFWVAVVLTVVVVGAAMADTPVASILAVVPGAFVVAVLPVIKTGVLTRRTEQGRALWAQVAGFRQVLSTTSTADRFGFADRPDCYSAYVPWAVVFGCTEQWATRYRAEVGVEPPQPGFLVSHDPSPAALVKDFDRVVTSAIATYYTAE
ncbi:MAG: DUF2207 domain-containing protein, partial [Micrococcales bacterium]|nr:DUF2207 domain-containing protein [Micrococcales bacterium]